jgi:hypothetical protein
MLASHAFAFLQNMPELDQKQAFLDTCAAMLEAFLKQLGTQLEARGDECIGHIEFIVKRLEVTHQHVKTDERPAYDKFRSTIFMAIATHCTTLIRTHQHMDATPFLAKLITTSHFDASLQE